jgi:PAS domain S-box-containing protein
MAGEQRARIVVVDDNPATLYSTSRILRAAGFDVTEAVNGQQALDFAGQGADLILLDVNLPDIHGFEVCKRLREDTRTKRLPVVHLSATFVKEIDKVQGLDSGGDGYLTHPVEPPVLIATVNAFLRTRRAEDEMRRSEAKFKAVFDNASSGILLLDRDLGYLEVNPAMCDLLARPREEIVGKPLSAFMPEGTTTDSDQIERTLETKGAWRGVFPLLRSDGRLAHLEWYISVHSFPGVRLAVVTDITERLRLEAERDDLLASERAARTQAERASYLKDEFLGTLSHELRTPLNSILLWTQMLSRRVKDSEVLRGLATIERSTHVQAQLISDLLDVSAIISGKLRLGVQMLDLVAIIKATLETLAPAIEAKELTLNTFFDPRVTMISGDPARLQQVIWNLINNASKFTPKGGRIEIRVERLHSEVKIVVGDNGQGIESDLLPYLFERFRQGDVSTKRHSGGLGLGLAIVKHLVELHGGTVTASSEGPGTGAQFTVILPISSIRDESLGPLAEPKNVSASDGVRLDGVRILLVDDDADSCNVMARLLNQIGAVITIATNVNDALEQLEHSNPQILVSDIGMPDRDGYDLIREVRARGHSFQNLPAIALTALAGSQDRRRALLAGYQVHLTKPIDSTDLTTAIAVLSKRSGYH